MQYKSWLLQQLRQLDHPEPCPFDAECVVLEARDRAAKSGLTDAVKACAVRRGPLAPNIVREVLTACLAAIPAPKTDGPYSVAEAAALLKISARKIYDDCKNGIIAHEKHPIRITAEALDEYNRQRQRGAIKTAGFKHLRSRR